MSTSSFRASAILTDGRTQVKTAARSAFVWGIALGLCWVVLAGCTAMAPGSSTQVLYIGSEPQRWEELVRRHPLGPEENVSGISLSDRPAVSHFIVQIRDRERPHMHKEHDATIVMLRGRGRLVMKEQVIVLHAGDSVFIPRGTRHYYINEGDLPTVVLAIFTPSYDGTDAVLLPESSGP